MSRLRGNIVANFLGQGWSGLMSVIFVPVYILLLGIESYGLIGLYASLQAFYYILDVGLSATLNRELARQTNSNVHPDQRRDLVRTLEWVYWPICFLIAGLTWSASEPIASVWLQPVSLTPTETAHAIALMGLSLSVQWPCSLYAGGFRGLERQVELNAISAVFVTLRSAGVIPVLYYVSPTIETFFWWQIAIGAIQTATMANRFWLLLPLGERRPRFRMERFREIAHFSAGMAGISLLSFFLAYADKIVLSKVLPLDQFGYYALATAASAVLSPFIQSFFNALYPRFSALVAGGNQQAVSGLYHESTRYLTAIVASVGAMIALFSHEILFLWSRDPAVANGSGLILSILIVGVALNGLVTLPYALQLAHGWTRLAMYQNLIAIALMAPGMWWLATHFGSTGAAVGSVVLNLGFLLISVPLMHRKLLRGELGQWYIGDVLPSALAAVVVACVARLVFPVIPSDLGGATILAGIGVTIFLSAAAFSPARGAVLQQLRQHVR